MLSSEYTKLIRIKDIVKDIEIKDFAATAAESSIPLPPIVEGTEEVRAKLMLQKFFSESS